MNKLIITLAVSALAICTFAQERGRMQANPDAKFHRFSTTVEKERPQLNQETLNLIAAWRRKAPREELSRSESRKSPRKCANCKASE